MMRIGGRKRRPPSALKRSDQTGHTLQSEGAVTKRFARRKKSLLTPLCSLMDDERMEGAVNEAAQDDQQDDQADDSFAGIACRFTIFDGDSGVGSIAAGS